MTISADIYTLLQPIIGGTVIFADQNSPRPALPYSTIKLSGFRRVNKDHYSDPDNAGIQTVKGDREFTVSIQNYGTADAETLLNDVAGKLQLTTNIDKFMAKKISCFNTGVVNDLSTVINNTMIESRASLDIFCRIKSSLTDNVGYIDTVTIAASDNSTATDYTIVAVDI